MGYKLLAKEGSHAQPAKSTASWVQKCSIQITNRDIPEMHGYQGHSTGCATEGALSYAVFYIAFLIFEVSHVAQASLQLGL